MFNSVFNMENEYQPFLKAISLVHVLFHNWNVTWHDSITTWLNKLKHFGGVWLVNVVEKDAAHTTTFVSVLNHKVFVAPFLKLSIVWLVMFVTCGFERFVKVFHILTFKKKNIIAALLLYFVLAYFFIQIIRRQIGASTKPPFIFVRCYFDFKIAIVEMKCGNVWVCLQINWFVHKSNWDKEKSNEKLITGWITEEIPQAKNGKSLPVGILVFPLQLNISNQV